MLWLLGIATGLIVSSLVNDPVNPRDQISSCYNRHQTSALTSFVRRGMMMQSGFCLSLSRTMRERCNPSSQWNLVLDGSWFKFRSMDNDDKSYHKLIRYSLFRSTYQDGKEDLSIFFNYLVKPLVHYLSGQ